VLGGLVIAVNVAMYAWAWRRHAARRGVGQRGESLR